MVDETVANCEQRAQPKVSAVAVDGQRINIATMSEAVDAILARLQAGRGFTFLTLNLDHMVKRRVRIPYFARPISARTSSLRMASRWWPLRVRPGSTSIA